MPDISKIKLPSGTTYDIKDTVAREAISGGVSFVIAWDGASVPVAASIPAGVTITYGGTTYTGTLAASSAQAGAFYLIYVSSTSSNLYDEYVPVSDGATKKWEKLGSGNIDLSEYAKKGDGVTGSAANSKTGVSVSNHTVTQGTTSSTLYYTTDEVYGTGTTFTNGSSSVSFTGGTTDTVLGTGTTATVPAYTASQTYLSATASGTAVGVATSAAAITNIGTGTAAAQTITVGTNDKVNAITGLTWSGSVSDETLTLGWTPTTDEVYGTATTFTNGSSSVSFTGGSTDTFAKTVSVTAQPTISLGSNAQTATGRVQVATGVSTSGTNSVTFGTNDQVTAVTGIGTGTAAAQTITVGTGDKVTVVKTVSGTTSSGASSTTVSGATSGVAVSAHSVTDNGHTHSVTGTINS